MIESCTAIRTKAPQVARYIATDPLEVWFRIGAKFIERRERERGCSQADSSTALRIQGSRSLPHKKSPWRPLYATGGACLVFILFPELWKQGTTAREGDKLASRDVEAFQLRQATRSHADTGCLLV
jgi:hypothetical protein